MASNVFQVFVTDDELAASLARPSSTAAVGTRRGGLGGDPAASRRHRPRAPGRYRSSRAAAWSLDADEVGAAMARAGFEVRSWYGDWSRGPRTEDSGNIVVVAGARS